MSFSLSQKSETDFMSERKKEIVRKTYFILSITL